MRTSGRPSKWLTLWIKIFRASFFLFSDEFRLINFFACWKWVDCNSTFFPLIIFGFTNLLLFGFSNEMFNALLHSVQYKFTLILFRLNLHLYPPFLFSVHTFHCKKIPRFFPSTLLYDKIICRKFSCIPSIWSLPNWVFVLNFLKSPGITVLMRLLFFYFLFLLW